MAKILVLILSAFVCITGHHSARADETKFNLGSYPAYVCASLMSSERKPRETDGDAHANRLAQFGRFVNRLGVSKLNISRVILPFTAAPVYPERYAVNQTLIGAEAIINYVDDAIAEARRLGAEHPSGEATQPFDFNFRPRERLTQLMLNTTLFASTVGLAWSAAGTNHPGLAIFASGLAGLVAVRKLIPTLRALYVDRLNAGLIEDFNRGKPGLKRGLDPRQRGDFERQIKDTVSWIKNGTTGLVDGSSPGGIQQMYIDLPMSRSIPLAHGKHVGPSSATEIIAAVRRSGDGVRPVDPRQIKLSFLLYLDEESSQPVLMMFGR